MPDIALDRARHPLAIAIDIGSSSVRCLAYDADGRQIADTETQIGHALRADRFGASEADPRHLFDLVVVCVDGTIGRLGRHIDAAGAIGMSCFWHGLLGLNDRGEPTTPVLMWADKRSGRFVTPLAAAFPPPEAIAATGCRIHSSYWPAKLCWLDETEPETFARTARWVSLPDYIELRLTGHLSTSVSMASGTGLLGLDDVDWYAPMLDAVGIRHDQLPAIVDRTEALPPLLPEYANRWPALATIPRFAAIGDGAAANVGAGCVGADRIALTVGTSGAMRTVVPDEALMAQGTPPGQLWIYRLDRNHRVLGGALSNGGNVTGWVAGHFAGGNFDRLTSEAERMQPDSHGLTVLPFLAGERSPSWDDTATGTITGLRLATTPGEVFRATLEASAYRFTAIYDDLRAVVTPDHEIHANGAAVLASPLWLQILADVLGHRIDALDAEAEASACGAAICALETIGARPSRRSTHDEIIRTYDPDNTTRDAYIAGRTRHLALERALAPFNHPGQHTSPESR
ncbi:MAG: gluconokinase [Thermomicrobiales bacterium]